MTLPEAITKLRAHYQHVLEVEAKATPGQLLHVDGYLCVVDINKDKKDDAIIAESYQPSGFKEDLDLFALSRNSIAPTARLVLELIKYDGCPAGQLCTEQERCYRCAALIACAEELEAK